jgi:monothiol glutaredoxin
MSEQAVHDWIRKTIANNDVVVFMKGTQKFPQCGFSAQVAQILAHLGVDYKDVNVLEDMSIREGIKAFSNWPTIPQLYVKGEFVGGCDIVREMFQEGELQQLLESKAIAHHKATMTA